jgi:hypothetical protein
LEMFMVFSCGTLSNHIANWSVCSVFGFWAGLQELKSAIDASRNPQGRRRTGFKRHRRMEDIFLF